MTRKKEGILLRAIIAILAALYTVAWLITRPIGYLYFILKNRGRTK